MKVTVVVEMEVEHAYGQFVQADAVGRHAAVVLVSAIPVPCLTYPQHRSITRHPKSGSIYRIVRANITGVTAVADSGTPTPVSPKRSRQQREKETRR